jgi:hypothetical protein
MDVVRALEIVRHLANGVDPFTGEELSWDSPLQNPEAVRALFLATAGLAKLQLRGEANRPVPKDARMPPARAGEPWSPQEDARLVKAYDEGKTFQDLALSHQRTVGAIESRLTKLGKITLYRIAELDEIPEPGGTAEPVQMPDEIREI